MEAVRGLEIELAGYDARYTQASQAHEAARSKLGEVRARIAKNGAELKRTQKQYLRSQKILGDRISMMYRQPQPSQVEVLLRSNSFSDFVAGANFMQRVRRHDSDVVQSTRAQREKIKEQRAELIADNEEAKAQSAEAARQVSEINTVRAQRRAVLSATRNQLAVMIAAEERRKANAARLAALRAAEQRVARRVGADSPASSAPAVTPVSAPASSAPAGGTAPSGALQAIAQCESGGNPTAVSPSGLYRGKYQFDPNTWSSLGGQGGDPAAASEAEQDRVAALLYSQQGASPWPVCGR